MTTHKDYMREYAKKNREKLNAYQRGWNKRNKDKASASAKKYRESLSKEQRSRIGRTQNLKSSYGLSLEDYERMNQAQHGLCAICFRPEANSKALSVDHCHNTKHVRGLLCFQCNSVLGNAHDNILVLRAAIEYLEKHNG